MPKTNIRPDLKPIIQQFFLDAEVGIIPNIFQAGLQLGMDKELARVYIEAALTLPTAEFYQIVDKIYGKYKSSTSGEQTALTNFIINIKRINDVCNNTPVQQVEKARYGREGFDIIQDKPAVNVFLGADYIAEQDPQQICQYIRSVALAHLARIPSPLAERYKAVQAFDAAATLDPIWRGQAAENYEQENLSLTRLLASNRALNNLSQQLKKVPDFMRIRSSENEKQFIARRIGAVNDFVRSRNYRITYLAPNYVLARIRNPLTFSTAAAHLRSDPHAQLVPFAAIQKPLAALKLACNEDIVEINAAERSIDADDVANLPSDLKRLAAKEKALQSIQHALQGSQEVCTVGQALATLQPYYLKARLNQASPTAAEVAIVTLYKLMSDPETDKAVDLNIFTSGLASDLKFQLDIFQQDIATKIQDVENLQKEKNAELAAMQAKPIFTYFDFTQEDDQKILQALARYVPGFNLATMTEDEVLQCCAFLLATEGVEDQTPDQEGVGVTKMQDNAGYVNFFAALFKKSKLWNDANETVVKIKKLLEFSEPTQTTSTAKVAAIRKQTEHIITDLDSPELELRGNKPFAQYLNENRINSVSLVKYSPFIQLQYALNYLTYLAAQVPPVIAIHIWQQMQVAVAETPFASVLEKHIAGLPAVAELLIRPASFADVRPLVFSDAAAAAAAVPASQSAGLPAAVVSAEQVDEIREILADKSMYDFFEVGESQQNPAGLVQKMNALKILFENKSLQHAWQISEIHQNSVISILFKQDEDITEGKVTAVLQALAPARGPRPPH